jgi:predicted MFS family arabinose efflux permease
LNRSLLLIAAALLTWGFGEGMFAYLQAIYLEELGADPITIGRVLGAVGLTMMVAHIPAGHLADRIGRRPVLIAGWLIGAVAGLLMGLAEALPLFVGGLLLYSFTAFVISPLNSYITAARGAWPIGRALSMISVSFGIGSVLGPVTGGRLAELYGLQTIFLLASGLFTASTVLILFLPPQPRDHHDPEAPPVRLLRNAQYLRFITLVFVITLSLYLPQPLTPNFLAGERGFSLQEIGLLGTIGVLGNTTITFSMGAWLSPRRAMFVGQLLTAGFSALIWQTTGLPAYALAFFILGGFRAVRPMMAAQARELVHESQMGLAYGMNETVGAVALALAPILAGVLYARAPDLMYPASLAAIGLSISLTLWIAPRPGGGIA